MAVVTGANGAELLADASDADAPSGSSGDGASAMSENRASIDGDVGLGASQDGQAAGAIDVGLPFGREAPGAGAAQIGEAASGDDFDDVLSGDADGNLLDGMGGDDALNGGGGDDTLVGGLGSNVVEGGAGQDTASYAWADGPVVINLTDGFAWVAGEAGISPAAEDALFGVEHAVGGRANDTLVGDGGANSLSGAGGRDSVSGGAGADRLSGEDGDDVLAGGRDDDTLFGGAGDDALDGGAGSDTAAFAGRRSDYVLTPAIEGSVNGGFVLADARSGGGGRDTVNGVELFAFSDGVVAASELVVEQPTPDSAPSPPSAVFLGTPADDRLWFQPGNELIDGLGGHDWVDMLAEGSRASTVTARFDGSVLVSHAGQDDALLNVEEVAFADGRLVFDADDPAAKVLRLYEAALDRLPDQAGLNFWIDALQDGQPLVALASGFLSSPEFQARSGVTAVGVGAFVDRMYQNVLGRAGDAEGRDFWAGALDRGAASRAEVLVAFSEGAENQAATAGLVQQGIWDRSEAAAEVARLYDTVFDRAPDVAGLAFWKGALDGGAATLAQVAGAFTASAEFREQYGVLDDRAFADALYANALDRPGDRAGLDHWAGALDAGAGRAGVALAFSESAEHAALTAGTVGGEGPAQFGVLFA